MNGGAFTRYAPRGARAGVFSGNLDTGPSRSIFSAIIKAKKRSRWAGVKSAIGPKQAPKRWL